MGLHITTRETLGPAENHFVDLLHSVMASGTTAHAAHHSFSIDYHVQAPPSHSLLSLSTEGEDDYYTPPASGRASPEEMTPLVETTRQVNLHFRER